MAEITVQNVSKVFPDGTRAVSDLDMRIPDGNLVVLVGPSGCGKTTLLRMVAGLEQPTAGTISIGGEVVNDTPPKNRDIAMVFQNYALYPHMTVYDNMAYALRRRREPRAAIQQRVTETAAMLGLTEHLKKKPAALSGGQRQRVAMGRAIVRQPKAFLMDEPLSNLDAKLRVEMRSEIMRIQRDLGVTTVFVTHDQTEALTMGDLVAVMRGGVVQQLAPPGEVFARPANLFVAGFIGSPPMNLVRARIERGEGDLQARLGRAAIPVSAERRELLAQFEGRDVALGIRPEDFRAGDLDPALPRIEAVVELRETLGRERYLHFTIDAPPAVTGEARELLADTDVIALEKLEAAAERNRTHMVARVPESSADTDRVELGVDTHLVEFFNLDDGRAIR